jgi:hypothetical protein
MLMFKRLREIFNKSQLLRDSVTGFYIFAFLLSIGLTFTVYALNVTGIALAHVIIETPLELLSPQSVMDIKVPNPFEDAPEVLMELENPQ